jgi:hypothetical protein
MLVRVTTRTSYVLLARHTDQHGWVGRIQITDGARKELTFLASNLAAQNGTLIKSSLLEVSLESIIPNPVAKKTHLNNHVRGERIFVSDSSEIKTFVYDLTDNKETILVSTFTEEQKALSSGARELLAVWLTLSQWMETKTMQKKVIYWLTDSENVVTFLSKGSKKPEVQKILFEIIKMAFELGLQIEPIHLFREDPRIQDADAQSKHLDSDNWSIDYASFEKLREQYEMEVDMFADATNTRLEKFCSLYYSPGTSAIDAFTTNWAKMGTMWLCPPVALLMKVQKRIATCSCKGVLVLPIWKTASFYNAFFDEKEEPKEPFKLIFKWHPYVFQNENARNTALFGNVPFKFAALEFWRET